MDAKTRIAAQVAAAMLAAALPAQEAAQNSPKPQTAMQENAPLGYSFSIDKFGNPVYTQMLCWDDDPAALEYGITIKNEFGVEILKKTIKENTLTMSLAPGRYTYDIVTYNLLGQPEAETGFQDLDIIRAEVPEIDGTSPAFIFMDSFSALIHIRGKLLFDGARVFIRKKGSSPNEGIEGIVTSHDGNDSMVIQFPDNAYTPGTFDIAVVNPGGLSSKAENALRIMYQRPFDILASVGYAPLSIVQGEWFKQSWNEPMYWPGGDATISVFFVKKDWGFLGLEATASAHRLTGGTSVAKLTSDYLLAGGNFLYKYRINKMFYVLTRTGGGVAVGKHVFTYSGRQGPQGTFSDPYADAGLAIQCMFPQKFFIELNADGIGILADSKFEGCIRPSLKFGYQVF